MSKLSAKNFRDEVLIVMGELSSLSGKPVDHTDVYDPVARMKGISRDQFGLAKNTKILMVDRWIQWAFKSLTDQGFAHRIGEKRGKWALTAEGIQKARSLICDQPSENSQTVSEEQDAETESVSLSIKTNQDEDSYHPDPYIRGLALKESSCAAAYSDKSAICSNCGIRGACINAMAAELSSLAQQLQKEDDEREAEERAQNRIEESSKASTWSNGTEEITRGSASFKASKDEAHLINIPQQSICTACGKTILRDTEGWWVRSSEKGQGGLFHKECLEVS